MSAARLDVIWVFLTLALLSDAAVAALAVRYLWRLSRFRAVVERRAISGTVRSCAPDGIAARVVVREALEGPEGEGQWERVQTTSRVASFELRSSHGETVVRVEPLEDATCVLVAPLSEPVARSATERARVRIVGDGDRVAVVGPIETAPPILDPYRGAHPVMRPTAELPLIVLPAAGRTAMRARAMLASSALALSILLAALTIYVWAFSISETLIAVLGSVGVLWAWLGTAVAHRAWAPETGAQALRADVERFEWTS